MAQGTMVTIDFNSDDEQSEVCKWRANNVYQQLLTVPGSVLEGPANILTDAHANLAELSNALNQADVVYLTGVGHGASDTFPSAPPSEAPLPVMLSTTQYDPPSVRGKVVHLVSCSTGFQLGLALAAPGGGGVAAFFGYSKPFSWPVGVPDKILDLVFSCDAQIDFALAAGCTAGEAYNQAVQAYQDAKKTILADYPDIGAQIAAALDANRACLCGPQVGIYDYGCADARL